MRDENHKTNHKTNQESEESIKGLQIPITPVFKGNEDSPLTGIPPSQVAEDTPVKTGCSNTARGQPQLKRKSRRELENLKMSLSERDLEILLSLKLCKYLSTDQIKRLHITDAKSDRAAIRAANRNLKKLRELNLIRPFKRQIGGVRAGSSAFIWHLTEAGYRLLSLDEDNKAKRKRFVEPSYAHLKHTLAITECYVQITEIARKHSEMKIKKVEFEPACWRAFSRNGANIFLKPDLFLITEVGEYEDHWFIEVDLSTEALPVITEKCERYHSYLKTGKEQTAYGVFPVVMWIVPQPLRKANIVEVITRRFLKSHTKLFTVITPDELERLITDGIREEDLC